MDCLLITYEGADISIFLFCGCKELSILLCRMTKFTLNRTKNPAEYWNGKSGLPPEINVMSYHPIISEFELLSLICSLHSYLTAFDILTGADPNSEKDADINAVMTAFQMYIYPKMPISNYSAKDKRINAGELTIKPIDGKN